MKKFALLIVALMAAVAVMGQNQRLKAALIKDEGGETNIRKGPGTKYPVVKKVKDGSYILWSGDFEDAWYKVYNQQGVFLGYISSSKMQLFDSPAW